jgi:hypothetical protein
MGEGGTRGWGRGAQEDGGGEHTSPSESMRVHVFHHRAPDGR